MIADKLDLPVTLMIIGTALATGPAACLLLGTARLHARRGDGIPAALAGRGVAGSGCSSRALLGATVWFLPTSIASPRPTACRPAMKSRVRSWVMAGGVVSGFVGPQLSAC